MAMKIVCNISLSLILYCQIYAKIHLDLELREISDYVSSKKPSNMISKTEKKVSENTDPIQSPQDHGVKSKAYLI